MGTTPRGCSGPPDGGRVRSVRGDARLAILLLAALLSACAPRRLADDLTISTKVKIELLADPALGALRLDVSTLNGVVTLSGAVPTLMDADRAVAAAKRVHGVRGTKSELKITGG